jgi:DNA-binding transcriptional LysR family regulator
MARLDWYIRANLKLRHLQILVALDDYHNLSKVAGLMHVTQSALSKTLSELQHHVGHQLFERTGRGLKPTEYGSILIRHARVLLQDLLEAGNELHAAAHGTSQRLKIGVQHVWASSLLPLALERMKRVAPDAAIFVREGSMDVLLPELRMGNIDTVVGTLPSRREIGDLEETPIFEDDTVLVTKVAHPLQRRARVSWSDAVRYPWILPPTDSLLRQPLIVAFGAHGIEPPTNYIETLSHNVTLHYLQCTEAIATMPASVATDLQSKSELAVLSLKFSRLMRPVGVIWKKGTQRNETLDLLIVSIKDLYKTEGS